MQVYVDVEAALVTHQISGHGRPNIQWLMALYQIHPRGARGSSEPDGKTKLEKGISDLNTHSTLDKKDLLQVIVTML